MITEASLRIEDCLKETVSTWESAVWISGQTIASGVVGACYRPPDQEKIAEAFFRQLEEVSHLWALVLMEDLNFTHLCWKENIAGHKQGCGFLEWIDDNFLDIDD